MIWINEINCILSLILSPTGTIRRFLEQFKTEIVLLCLEPHERGIYEVLAPLYFPRNNLEENSALWQLPKDIGGFYGEPQLPDRQIRIIHNPHHSVMLHGEFQFILWVNGWNQWCFVGIPEMVAQCHEIGVIRFWATQWPVAQFKRSESEQTEKL